MRNTWLLLKVQLSALLGFNKIIHLKEKKERRKKMTGRIAIMFCMLMAVAAVGAYAFLFAMGMNELGQIGLFPGFMLAATCMMTLISSVSMANGTLFSFKDYDLVMSLPVKPMEVALSRLLLGYVCNAMFDLIIMIPCGAAYAYFARPAASFYPIFVATMFAAPVAPMIVGSMIGAVAARLTASFRGAKYLQMLGSTALCLGMMYLSFSMGSMEEFSIFGDWGAMIGNMMNRVYPLTGMYVSAVRDLNWLSAVLFVLIAAAFMAASALVMGKWLRKINTLLSSSRAKRNFRMRALNTSSPLAALYKKELRRYLSSVTYLFNTAFSLVLALIGIGVLAVKGREMIRLVMLSMAITGLDEQLIVYALGYIGAFLAVAACTTSSSISLEGKNIWLIQSLPVTGFEVLASKILVNLTLSVPTSLVVGLGVGWTLSLGAMDTASVTAMCLAYSLMSACMGLFINLKNHNFEWTNETAVVKQGAATGIHMGVGMLLIAAPAVLTFVFAEYAQLIFWLTTLAMAGIGAGLLYAFKAKGDLWISKL